MKSLTTKETLLSPLFVPGLVFLWVNLSVSYMFYHVNSYKIFLMGIGVSLLFVLFDLVPNKRTDHKMPWGMFGILAFPVLATLPGLVVHGADYNYNFKYELVTNLVLILWSLYLVRRANSADDLMPFLLLIGLTMIYSGLWSFLETVGWHPLFPGSSGVEMAKSTFGHRNYFSGFLILLLPLLLTFSVPALSTADKKGQSGFLGLNKRHYFFMAAFILGILSLIFAETRAAIAGCFLGLVVTCYLYALFFTDRKWRKRLLQLLVVAIVVAIIGVILLYVFKDDLRGSRFAALFTLRAWLGRLIPWETAITSIKASPWVGYGLGSSYNLFFSFVSPEARLFHREHSYNHAHSEILEYIQESGILGIIAYLAFWGIVLYQLIRLFRSEKTHPTVKKVLVGITGGFVAYQLHSVFSVAPRMMVMKMPLYTLYGLLFVAVKLQRDTEPATEKGYRLKLPAILVSAAMLLAAWVLYMPWAWQQYSFVELQSRPNSLFKVEALEDLAEKSTDIYTQDALAHLQIQYGRAEQLEKTIQRIDRDFPHYRELGHKKAILAMMQNDVQKAKEAALQFQKKDTYHTPTIRLLMNLAIRTNDPELFTMQFKLLSKKLLYEFQVMKSTDSSDVEITVMDLDRPFRFSEMDEKIYAVFDRKWVSYIFDTSRINYVNRSWSPDQRSRFWTSLAEAFGRAPYFKIKIREEYLEEYPFSVVNAKVEEFFRLKREWEWGRKQLIQERNQTLGRTSPSRRPEVAQRMKEKIELHDQKFKSQMNEIEDLLKGKTDWSHFHQKQKFANDFIGQLTTIAFHQS